MMFIFSSLVFVPNSNSSGIATLDGGPENINFTTISMTEVAVLYRI